MSTSSEGGTTEIFGFHPVREALRSRPHGVREVLISTRRAGRRRLEIEELCRRHQVPVREGSEAELRELGREAHNGFVARLAAGDRSRSAGDRELLVLVEDVQDPRNLGALLRVCEAVGVGGVFIRDRGSAPATPTVVKASAGATEWLEIERMTNSSQRLRAFKEEGFWVYGTDASGVPPWELDLSGPIVLCFGGEERGLRRLTRELCDATIGLPMVGRLESLNLATAASAVLYEALRQRRAPRP